MQLLCNYFLNTGPEVMQLLRVVETLQSES